MLIKNEDPNVCGTGGLRVNINPTSTTLAQHLPITGSMSRICWKKQWLHHWNDKRPPEAKSSNISLLNQWVNAICLCSTVLVRPCTNIGAKLPPVNVFLHLGSVIFFHISRETAHRGPGNNRKSGKSQTAGTKGLRLTDSFSWFFYLSDRILVNRRWRYSRASLFSTGLLRRRENVSAMPGQRSGRWPGITATLARRPTLAEPQLRHYRSSNFKLINHAGVPHCPLAINQSTGTPLGSMSPK